MSKKEKILTKMCPVFLKISRALKKTLVARLEFEKWTMFWDYGS